MKYLNNREEFLKRSIKKIDEYKKYEPIESINEDVENSGPFANDIPWGDSLLGRLINSTIRKAKIGANLVRIKGVVRRLKDAFDEILGTSASSKLSEEDQKELTRLKVYTFLDNLQKAVENEENVGEIKNLTKAAIKDIESFEDFDGKAELLDQLEKFSKFLEQFKDDEGGEATGGEEGEEGKGEGEEGKGEGEGKEGEGEGASADKKSAESLYPVMVKNLKALGLILANYKNVKIVGVNKIPDLAASNQRAGTYITKAGDTVDKIVANTEVNKKKFTADVLRQKNQKVLSPFPKNNQTLKPGLVLVMERAMIFEAVPGTNNQPGGSQDRGNIKGGEDHLTQAFTKLKKDIEVLISAKEKGIGVDTNFIKEITSKAVDSNTKNQIKALYVEINRYLVGDKKATIQEKDPLYKESLEIITDKNKRVVVAEKMARFTKRALQFDKEGLYGGLGDLTKPLQDYVETIKQLMQMAPVEPKKEEKKPEEGKKEEVKKESHLFRYDRFITMLKEADEEGGEGDKKDDKEKGVGAPDVMTTSQKIKDYWQKNIDIKEYVIEKTEAIKMKEKFDKLEKEQGDSIQIQGIDPVLDVVKCFNRAYKIHTTQVIPSGRSGGRVSNSVFMEYTSFGGGSPDSAGKSGGPYRNNAIFNQWEDAVLNIMRDKTYQRIFNVGTTLQVGNEVIEKAGSNLRKFMSDMLDGEELYKGGDGKGEAGQQAKFLDKYFNYKVEDAKDTNFGGREEQEEVTDLSRSMPDGTPVKFSKEPCKYQKADELKGTFFAISTKGDGKMHYFYIQDVKGDIAYIVYCRVFTFFKKYLESSVIKLDPMGDLPKACNSTDRLTDKGSEKVEFILKATTKKVEDIVGTDGKFKLSGNTYEITYLTRYEGKKNNVNAKAELADKPDTLEVDRCYTLIENKKDVEVSGEKTRFTLTKSIGPAIAQYGGFKDITTTNDISKAKITRL